MEGTFTYSKYVTGKHFLGRKTEISALENLLSQGFNVVIYEPPKTGKMSLIHQAFYKMKTEGKNFRSASISLLNLRDICGLAIQLGSEVLRCFCNSSDEFASAAKALLPESSLYFDEEQYFTNGTILQNNGNFSYDDLRMVLTMPYKAAERTGGKIYILLTEFQNIMLTEDGDGFCKLLYEIFKELDPQDRGNASYIITGSAVNAMHDIFGRKKAFFRQVERIKLGEIETRDIIDYVNHSLMAGGKVIDRDLMLGTCKLFRNNVWYINHFASICDSLSKGYIREDVLTEALERIIAIHEPRFISTMNSLTTFQINLLKAVLCGKIRFTSSEVISQFDLSSSANVRRLKDALAKKEIVSFENEYYPQLIDPLFEYWVRTQYFGMKI